MNQKAETMMNLFVGGKTYEEIGRQYGVSRQRIQQILKPLGASRRTGGIVQRSYKIRNMLAEERRRKFVARHGLTPEQIKEMRALGLTEAYRSQKNAAKNRGIDWKLNPGQWFAIWLLSGKLSQRGRERGQFVMARFLDEGAYEWGNVEIITSSENCSMGRTKHRQWSVV